MPKVSEAYFANRQDQILDAAIQCFARNGFHATTIADVIKASGLSAGSVYRYYKSKDDLIIAIVERLLGILDRHLTRVRDRNSPPAEAIAEVITGVDEMLSAQHGSLARLMPQVWAEALRNEAIKARAESSYRVVLEHFGELARRAQGGGTLKGDMETTAIASVLMALVQGYLLQRLLLGERVPTAVYVATVRGLLRV